MRKFEITLAELGKFAQAVQGGGTVNQAKLDEILSQLGVIQTQGQQLMAVTQGVQAKLDAVAAALDSAATGLAADIQALKDQLIAANNGMTEADVLAAFAPIDARVQALTDLDVANPPATPPTI